MFQNITHLCASYFLRNNPAGLASVDKLYREIKKVDKKTIKNNVKLFLSGQDSYTLYNVLPRKFPRSKCLLKKPGYTIVFDVFYLNTIFKAICMEPLFENKVEGKYI